MPDIWNFTLRIRNLSQIWAFSEIRIRVYFWIEYLEFVYISLHYKMLLLSYSNFFFLIGMEMSYSFIEDLNFKNPKMD